VKALSLRQPWAWAVVHAGKSIENRRWNTRYRGDFLIHAAVWPGDVTAMAAKADAGGRRSRPLDDAHEEALSMLDMARAAGVKLHGPVSMRDLYGQRGGIIGRARLVDVIHPCAGKRAGLFDQPCPHAWHMPEQYGFVLEDIRPLPFVPFIGALSFFDVPDALVAT